MPDKHNFTPKGMNDMSDMRGIDTQVRKRRRRVFKEVANLAYTSQNLKDDCEALPYKIVDYDTTDYLDSVYRDRAIIREQIRLAMGMSLRPENRDRPGHLTEGIEESNIDEKYYEPPLMQVIPSACNACPVNQFEVTDTCMGCLAHPCREVCPVGAMTMVNGKSFIDQDKCIKCGKCKAVCPYDAISHRERPCKKACGINAIESDKHGRAVINSELCVSCGQCMVSCPFGAIADKSQIFQLIRALQSGRMIIAQVAPSFAGQFGPKVTPDMFKTALKELGFAEVYETAIGADMGCVAEAEHYVREVATGKQAFALTSCCPSWAMMAKNLFPETIDKISNELTPMVATARVIKEKHPDVEWDFTILKSGPLGGDQQMGSRIVDGEIDYLFFFTDPMTLQPHDTDVKALTRLAGVENIVFCCNRSTADHIISSPLFVDPTYERTIPDYTGYTKRFENKPVVAEAVESAKKRKKKRG